MQQVLLQEFARRGVALVHDVAQNRESLTIMEEGKAIAVILPCSALSKSASSLLGTIDFETDIVSPVNEDWEADS